MTGDNAVCKRWATSSLGLLICAVMYGKSISVYTLSNGHTLCNKSWSNATPISVSVSESV